MTRLVARYLSLFILFLFTVNSHATEIAVEGAGEKLKTNLLAHFSSVNIKSRQASRQQRQLKATAQKAGRALGYYEAEYLWDFTEEPIKLTVIPGKRILWGNAELNIRGDATDVDLSADKLADRYCEAGKGVNQSDYDQLKREWLRRIHEAGYLDARYQLAELRIDLQKNLAVPVLHVVTGARYHVGNLTFSGSDMDGTVLQRLSPLFQHSVYTQVELTELRRNLENSRYFSSISLQTKKHSDNTVDIEVMLEDAASHVISVGVGYDTDTGPRTRLRVDTPQVNRRGHRFLNELEISEPKQTLTSTYQIPLSRPLVKHLDFSASMERTEVESVESTLVRLGAFIADEWQDQWQVNYGANLYYEEGTEGDMPTVYTRYLAPSVNFQRTVYPVTLDPLSGNSMLFAATGSAKTLGADTHFLRVRTGYKRLFSLGGSHTLLAKAEVGAVITNDIAKVPLSQRFFAGGDQSIRGYDFHSLSPRNSNGELQGGQYLNLTSLEYSVRVLPSWRLAVFADSGRAYNDSDAVWHTGAGFGVRWLSPIGQVRIDLAAPVADDESGVQLHISMGSIL